MPRCRDVRFEDDEDDEQQYDETLALLPPRVAESIRTRDHRLQENRAELLRLLTESENKCAGVASRYQSAISTLTDELTSAHTTIALLRREREKLKAQLREATEQIELWGSRTAKERDKAASNERAVEVERDRVAGLESLLAESHRRERQLASDSAAAAAESHRNSLEWEATMRRAERAERDLEQCRKELAATQERLAAANETTELIRQEHRSSASVLELNATLTRHVAAAVKANQTMSEKLMRFPGLQECLRPIPASAVPGLYEFDDDRYQRWLDRQAVERAEEAEAQCTTKKRIPVPSRGCVGVSRNADPPPHHHHHHHRSASPRQHINDVMSEDSETDAKAPVAQRRSKSHRSRIRNPTAPAAAELVTTVDVTHRPVNCTCKRPLHTVHVEGPICDKCRRALSRGEMTPPTIPGKTDHHRTTTQQQKYRVCIHTPDRRTIVL